MQDFLKWTLEAIRKDGSSMSWMEEKRLEWVPLAASMLNKMLQGHSFIVITDDERDWFGKYIITSINKFGKNRPFIPFLPLESCFFSLHSSKTKEDLDLLEDMLNLSFPNGYTYFYIGKSGDVKAQIAKRRDDSFLWIMDEEVQNSFYFRSNDEMLDVKLIQLFKLLDKSIDALLFAEVNFGHN
ncbi:MAG: HobA family DNA replication regulator [Campylobacteraceae bacterium]